MANKKSMEVVDTTATEVAMDMNEAKGDKPVFGALDAELKSVLTINPDEYYEKINGKDGDVEIVKKVIDFAQPMGNRTQVTAYDAKFIEITEKIKKALTARDMITYVVCKELSNISESGMLDKYGFKNVAEYGKALFGLERQTVNHYVRIGKNFINDDYTVKGGLPKLSVAHFIELNSMVGENGELDGILALYQNGTLVDGMGTKKVREALNAIKKPLLESKEDTNDKAEDSKAEKKDAKATVEKVEDEPTTEELKAEFDSQIVIGQILNACTRIEELFSLLSENEIKATGYTESLETIKGLAKTLLK
jgi:hypothetical protein